MPRRKTIDDDILLAAIRVALLAGGLGLSSKRMAAAAGVSEALLFQRFGDKRAIIFRALAIDYRNTPDLRAGVVEGGDCRSNLIAILTNILAWFREIIPAQNLLMTHPDFDLDHPGARHDRAEVSRVRAVLRDFLAGETARGRLNIPDVDGMVAILVAVLHSRVAFGAMGARGALVASSLDDSALIRVVYTLWPALTVDDR